MICSKHNVHHWYCNTCLHKWSRVVANSIEDEWFEHVQLSKSFICFAFNTHIAKSQNKKKVCAFHKWEEHESGEHRYTQPIVATKATQELTCSGSNPVMCRWFNLCKTNKRKWYSTQKCLCEHIRIMQRRKVIAEQNRSRLRLSQPYYSVER